MAGQLRDQCNTAIPITFTQCIAIRSLPFTERSVLCSLRLYYCLNQGIHYCLWEIETTNGIMFPRSGLRTDVVDTLRITTSVLHRYVTHEINSNRFPLLHKRIHTMMESASEEEMNRRIEDDIYLRLPPNTSKHWYTGLDEFWSCIDLERARFYDSIGSGRSSEYVVFFNVSKQTFAQDFDIARHKSSWQLVNSYNPSTEILLVKLPTRDHERAHGSLINLMITKLAGMNAANLSLDWYGAADKRTPFAHEEARPAICPPRYPRGPVR